MRIRPLHLLAAMIFLMNCESVHAQSLFGGTSGTSSGARTGGTSGLATQSGLQGQTGSATNTGQALGTTNLNAADGSLSATVGQGAFVGGQNNGNFTGNRFAGQTASQGVQAQFGNLTSNNRTQNRNTQGQSDRKAVRPQFRIAFETPTIPATNIEQQLKLATVELPPISSRAHSVSVGVDATGMVTLAGVVASERDKKLLESYVRMEPGVRSVQSELTVMQP